MPKAANRVTESKVSRQMVMRSVRKSKPVQAQVAVLHIDADEDHITLSNGRKSMVPLILSEIERRYELEGTQIYCA